MLYLPTHVVVPSDSTVPPLIPRRGSLPPTTTARPAVCRPTPPAHPGRLSPAHTGPPAPRASPVPPPSLPRPSPCPLLSLFRPLMKPVAPRTSARRPTCSWSRTDDWPALAGSSPDQVLDQSEAYRPHLTLPRTPHTPIQDPLDEHKGRAPRREPILSAGRPARRQAGRRRGRGRGRAPVRGA